MKWLVISFVCVALMSSCRSSEQEVVPATEVLRFWHTFNAEEAKSVETLVDKFEADHPGVRVEVTVLPFGSARHRLRSALREGTGPDLARAEVAWIPEFVQESLLHDLTGVVNLDAHLAQAHPFVTHGQKVWAFPQSVDCLVLYYNRSLLAQAGVAPPETMEALLSAARRLTVDAQGKTLLDPDYHQARAVRHGLFLKGDGYAFLPFLWAYGGRTLDPVSGQVFVGDAASVEAARKFQALGLTHGVSPGRVDFANDYQEEITRFGQGRVAMIINGPWAANSLLRGEVFQDPNNLGIVPVPRGPGGLGGSPVGGHGYVVPRASKKRTLALALGEFLAQKKAQVHLAQQNHILPTRKSAYRQPALRDDAMLVAFGGALRQAHPRAVFPGMARLFDALSAAVQKLLLGEGHPEVLMQGVAREWRAVLPTAPKAAPVVPDTEGSSASPGRP